MNKIKRTGKLYSYGEYQTPVYYININSTYISVREDSSTFSHTYLYMEWDLRSYKNRYLFNMIIDFIYKEYNINDDDVETIVEGEQ